MTRPANRVALAFIASIACISALRLHFGVDLTDEAYYALFPYRFALGDVPYVDDLNVRQNAGILTLPIVKILLELNGDADGLILSLRYAYFAVRVTLVAIAIRALRNRVPEPLAYAVSIVPVAYVFLSIPSLGYNTISGSLVTAALLMLLRWWEAGVLGFAIGASTAALLATYAHPALLPVTVIILCVTILLAPSSDARGRGLRVIIAVCAIAVLVLLAGAAALGRPNLVRLFSEAGVYTGPPADLGRLSALAGRLAELSRWAPALAVLWLALWRSTALSMHVLLAIVGSYAGIAILGANNEAVVIWLALGSIPLSWSFWRASHDASLLCVSSLSVASALTNALFSTNGVINAAVGSEVAVMTFFISAYKLLLGGHETFPALRVLALRLLQVMTLVAVTRLVVGQWIYFYRDDLPRYLRSTVAEGPYAGIRTSEAKANYIGRVQKALNEHSAGKQTLLVFNRFPGAHLMATLRPAVPFVWLADYPMDFVQRIRAVTAAEVARAETPMLVLQVFRLPETRSESEHWNYEPTDTLVRAIMARHPRLLTINRDFALYEITGSSAR